MNFKKLFKNVSSVLLVLSMLMTILPISISATDSIENQSITVYVTVGSYGEIVSSGDTLLALVPIELTDKPSYTLDDVFTAVHDEYYFGQAEEGYGTYTHEIYGMGLTKFWGDESGTFGYQINGGTEYVMNLSHEVNDGDCIDVFIYENYWPDTELYTVFDKNNIVAGIGESFDLVLSQMDYDENYNVVFAPCSDASIIIDEEASEYTTNSDGIVSLSFDESGTYVISAAKVKTVSEREVTSITAPVCVVSVIDADSKITVPADANLYVGQKEGLHFVSFTEIQPVDVLTYDDTKAYYFALEDDSIYNYRVSGDDYITYAGVFEKAFGFNLKITEDILCPSGKTKTTVDRDLSSNESYNVADIYLNINPQGYLKLSSTGDVYQLIPLRNWEAIDNEIANYFIEPDYHYTIIDESGLPCDDVVSIDENGLLTATGEGVAIVLVTYDALMYENGLGGPFYGAIWPENTGVFVVSVGCEDSGITTGMTINVGKNSTSTKLSGDYLDAEHDIIYFIGESGSYTFTPETEGCTVSVANPIVSDLMSFAGFEDVLPNDDGSFSVPLVQGRNIVKIENGNGAEYQVITAKEISISINDGDTTIRPGDSLTITFDTLYHPANKLAGVYNMSALPVYTEVSGYEDTIVGGLSAQYDFSSNPDAQTVSNILTETDFWGSVVYEKEATLTIPSNYKGSTFTLSGGTIYVTGWGDSYGNHRNISLTTGKAPNLDANPRDGVLGILPDIEIKITQRNTSGGSSGSGGSPIYKEPVDEETPEVETSVFADNTFSDVSEDDWFFDSIKYVYEKGLMNGVGDGFAPDECMTRAMLVTVLYRNEGEPATEGTKEVSFTDIDADEYYTKAVIWAAENGIVNGVTDTLFAPDENITREQLAAILFRYAEKSGYDVSSRADLSQFSDNADISKWASDAISWANASAIISGTSQSTLSPLDNTKRCEVATMLMRFCKNIN